MRSFWTWLWKRRCRADHAELARMARDTADNFDAGTAKAECSRCGLIVWQRKEEGD